MPFSELAHFGSGNECGTQIKMVSVINQYKVRFVSLGHIKQWRTVNTITKVTGANSKQNYYCIHHSINQIGQDDLLIKKIDFYITEYMFAVTDDLRSKTSQVAKTIM